MLLRCYKHRRYERVQSARNCFNLFQTYRCTYFTLKNLTWSSNQNGGESRRWRECEGGGEGEATELGGDQGGVQDDHQGQPDEGE